MKIYLLVKMSASLWIGSSLGEYFSDLSLRANDDDGYGGIRETIL